MKEEPKYRASIEINTGGEPDYYIESLYRIASLDLFGWEHLHLSFHNRSTISKMFDSFEDAKCAIDFGVARLLELEFDVVLSEILEVRERNLHGKA
jgi:hypothetical protein